MKGIKLEIILGLLTKLIELLIQLIDKDKDEKGGKHGADESNIEAHRELHGG